MSNDNKNNDVKGSVAKMLGKLGGLVKPSSKPEITSEQVLARFSARPTYQQQTQVKVSGGARVKQEENAILEAFTEKAGPTINKTANTIEQAAGRNSAYESHKNAVKNFATEFDHLVEQLHAGQGAMPKAKN